MVAFIRLLLLYTFVTALLVGNNWKDLVVGFLRMANGVMTGAVAVAGQAAGGGVSNINNPAEVLSSIVSALDEQLNKIDRELDKHIKRTEKGLEQRVQDSERGHETAILAP